MAKKSLMEDIETDELSKECRVAIATSIAIDKACNVDEVYLVDGLIAIIK